MSKKMKKPNLAKSPNWWRGNEVSSEDII